MAVVAAIIPASRHVAPIIVSHDMIFSKIQEVLPVCVESDDIQLFLDIFDGKVSDPVKVYVETAVRYYVVQSLCRGNDTDLSQIVSVAKFSIILTRNEVCLQTLPMLVLSDALDSLTVQQCEKLFSFVESSVAVWKEPLFFGPSKNQVLRMCNDVLRRLSRSQNTIFCGRILLFLARFFPFSERSGLNLISEFNLENITTFSSGNAADAGDDGMDVSEVKDDVEEETKEVTVKVDDEGKSPSQDHTLYTKFWALQDFFRNPLQCYQKAPWAKYTSYTSDVLEAFSSFKLDCETSGSMSAKRTPITYPDVSQEGDDHDKTIVDCLPDVKKIDQYFAKFLTNQRLLDLQFSDSNFRRYFLVQQLVLCHYLTASIKFKLEKLADSQVEWVRATEAKVFALLRETPPDGDQFVAIITRIIKREELWNEWKNNGCPEIKKPVQPVAVTNGTQGTNQEGEGAARRGRKRRLGDMIHDADQKNKFSMANNEMTRLWNLCPDNVEATRHQKRDFVPSLEKYFAKAIEQINAPDDQPDRLVQDGNFGWRGLRILACRSPHFFTHSTAPIATLPEYLSTMIKKLAKDMPQLNGGRQQPQQKKHCAEESSKQEEEQDKIMEEGVEEVMEGGDEEVSREELLPLTKDEQVALATNLAALGAEKWKTLTNKLGFKDDEVDYILKQKADNAQECIAHFLQLWVENEGDEGNKDTIVYTLEGLKMQEVANGVF